MLQEKNSDLIEELNELWKEVETEINESEIREDSAKLAQQNRERYEKMIKKLR